MEDHAEADSEVAPEGADLAAVAASAAALVAEDLAVDRTSTARISTDRTITAVGDVADITAAVAVLVAL